MILFARFAFLLWNEAQRQVQIAHNFYAMTDDVVVMVYCAVFALNVVGLHMIMICLTVYIFVYCIVGYKHENE